LAADPEVTRILAAAADRAKENDLAGSA